MSFTGVTINQLNGNLGGQADNDDNVIALIAAVSVANLPAGKLHHVPYLLLQLKDAEDMGITTAYDANKLLLVHDTLEQIFLYAPEAKVYLIFAPVASPAVVIASTGVVNALKQAPDVKGFGIIGTTDTLVQVATQLTAIQAVINAFKAENRLIDFAIIPALGETISANILTIPNYPNLRALVAPNVSVSVAQDPNTAAIDAAYTKYADVGAVLGMLAIRGVNENLGSVDINRKPNAKKGNKDYPLTYTPTKRWLTANLSDGKKVSDLSKADKTSLTAKGYIFAGSYDGYGGVFFNSSPTAVEKGSDYSYIERNRTWNKAARLIRTALIPEVKRNVKKDVTTGYIKSTSISRWVGIVNKVLEQMQASDEISGYSVYINPKQILSETSPLIVKASVVADDIVHEFSVDLGLAKQA